MEQRSAAVNHYLEHGRYLSRTIKASGYPSKWMLKSWRDEIAPGARKMRIGGIQYSQKQKKEAVIALFTRTGSAKDIANKYGITREVLYNGGADKNKLHK